MLHTTQLVFHDAPRGNNTTSASEQVLMSGRILSNSNATNDSLVAGLPWFQKSHYYPNSVMSVRKSSAFSLPASSFASLKGITKQNKVKKQILSGLPQSLQLQQQQQPHQITTTNVMNVLLQTQKQKQQQPQLLTTETKREPCVSPHIFDTSSPSSPPQLETKATTNVVATSSQLETIFHQSFIKPFAAICTVQIQTGQFVETNAQLSYLLKCSSMEEFQQFDAFEMLMIKERQGNTLCNVSQNEEFITLLQQVLLGKRSSLNYVKQIQNPLSTATTEVFLHASIVDKEILMLVMLPFSTLYSMVYELIQYQQHHMHEQVLLQRVIEKFPYPIQLVSLSTNTLCYQNSAAASNEEETSIDVSLLQNLSSSHVVNIQTEEKVSKTASFLSFGSLASSYAVVQTIPSKQ